MTFKCKPFSLREAPRLVILYFVSSRCNRAMFFCFFSANFGLRKTLGNLNNPGIRREWRTSSSPHGHWNLFDKTFYYISPYSTTNIPRNIKKRIALFLEKFVNWFLSANVLFFNIHSFLDLKNIQFLKYTSMIHHALTRRQL